MLNFLQKFVDFEAIVRVLIVRKRSDLLFEILAVTEGTMGRKKFKSEMIFAAFRESLKLDELAISFKMWKMYELLLMSPRYKDRVLQEIVNTFVRTPYLLEVKIYFLLQVIDMLNYEHVDSILISCEERFGEIAADGSNSYLLTNLNQIKTACHMLMLLNLITKKYSMTGLRTDTLGDILLKQAKSVFQNLFFPKKIKFQVQQIDLMNRNCLFYLERLNAFEIMETHIMDRIMQEYWQSNLDASGSFFSDSTSYQILEHYSDRFSYDFESENRFYKPRV